MMGTWSHYINTSWSYCYYIAAHSVLVNLPYLFMELQCENRVGIHGHIISIIHCVSLD